MLAPRMISRQFDELQAVRNRVRIKRIQGIPAAGLVAIYAVAVAASNPWSATFLEQVHNSIDVRKLPVLEFVEEADKVVNSMPLNTQSPSNSL